eukprot:6208237-Pleurochrysis_carterae.AAC.4
MKLQAPRRSCVKAGKECAPETGAAPRRGSTRAAGRAPAQHTTYPARRFRELPKSGLGAGVLRVRGQQRSPALTKRDC